MTDVPDLPTLCCFFVTIGVRSFPGVVWLVIR